MAADPIEQLTSPIVDIVEWFSRRVSYCKPWATNPVQILLRGKRFGHLVYDGAVGDPADGGQFADLLRGRPRSSVGVLPADGGRIVSVRRGPSWPGRGPARPPGLARSRRRGSATQRGRAHVAELHRSTCRPETFRMSTLGSPPRLSRLAPDARLRAGLLTGRQQSIDPRPAAEGRPSPATIACRRATASPEIRPGRGAQAPGAMRLRGRGSPDADAAGARSGTTGPGRRPGARDARARPAGPGTSTRAARRIGGDPARSGASARSSRLGGRLGRGGRGGAGRGDRRRDGRGRRLVFVSARTARRGQRTQPDGRRQRRSHRETAADPILDHHDYPIC